MLKTARTLLLAGWVSALFQTAGSAYEQTPQGAVVFDIPSQSLEAAIETYARISGREVLYYGRLAEGRRSSLVQGAYTAETALQILLAGTGLQADAKDDRFFMLSRVPARSAADRSPGSSADAHYYGALQAGLRAALCGSHPWLESRRIAARLWLGQTGGVLQAKLLSSTGNDEWDQQALAALHRVRIAELPPGFAQPVTIILSPRSSDADDGCAAQRQPPTRASR
jgi:hypothetical protein